MQLRYSLEKVWQCHKLDPDKICQACQLQSVTSDASFIMGR